MQRWDAGQYEWTTVSCSEEHFTLYHRLNETLRKYYSRISLDTQKIQQCHEYIKQQSRPLFPNTHLKCHRDGCGVGEEANCMHVFLQWAQYYYRYQFILERNWYSHILSQMDLTDPWKITDTYTYKWPKKARNQLFVYNFC